MIWLLTGSADPYFLISPLSFSPSLFWLVVGGILCLVELVVPTAFTASMMGVSALLVALVALILPKQLALQVALWLGLAVTFVYLTHRFLPKRKVSSVENAIEAQTLTQILPGECGRVLYEGSSWRARCEDERLAIPVSQKVYIVGREGTTLIVMPENLLKS